MGTFPMVNGTTINLFLYKNKQFPTSLSSSSHDVKEPFLIKLEKGKKKQKHTALCAKNVTNSVTVHTCTKQCSVLCVMWTCFWLRLIKIFILFNILFLSVPADIYDSQ